MEDGEGSDRIVTKGQFVELLKGVHPFPFSLSAGRR